VGKFAPETVKPVPVAPAPLIVRGALPVDLRITDCVIGAFKATLPKERLFVLQLMVATEAESCRLKDLDTPLALATRITDLLELTAETVAVNVALEALAGITRLAGVETALLLLASWTVIPVSGATLLKETVQASVPAPTMEA